jgi:hypothetical protein
MRRAILSLSLLLLALAPACKQGEGERCQIDDDCSGGLVCSDSQHICVGTGGSPPDGVPIPDAHPPDATVDGGDGPAFDGAPDGTPDGAIDGP